MKMLTHTITLTSDTLSYVRKAIRRFWIQDELTKAVADKLSGAYIYGADAVDIRLTDAQFERLQEARADYEKSERIRARREISESKQRA